LRKLVGVFGAEVCAASWKGDWKLHGGNASGCLGMLAAMHENKCGWAQGGIGHLGRLGKVVAANNLGAGLVAINSKTRLRSSKRVAATNETRQALERCR